MLMRRAWIVGAAAVAGGLAIALAVRAPSASPRSPASPAPGAPGIGGEQGQAAEAEATPGERVDSPSSLSEPSLEALTIDDVLRVRSDPAGGEVLVAALDADDAIVVAEAAGALVARGAVSVLPVLLAHDVLGRPWSAPSIIDALGRLGALADADERGEVVERLIALLRAEKQRGALESQGNLLQIYEALGQTGDARAIAPLEGELLDPDVAMAPKVVVVHALVALRAKGSRPVLEQLRARLETAAPGVGFEAELRGELIAELTAALAQL
jgi:hypothetical protein